MMFSRRDLVKLIIPLIIEQTLAVTIGMADTIMVTTVGEAAVSGISIVDSINILLINIFAALATGGAIVVAQYLGKEDGPSAKTAASQLVLSTTAISVVMMVGCLLGQNFLLDLVYGNVDAAVMVNARTYFFWSALSYPFLALYNGGAALFRVMGNSKVSMFCSLLMNIINIGGNAFLIFVMGWGVAGAAIASLVSRAVAALVVMALLRKEGCPLRMDSLRALRPNLPVIKSILRLGIPNGVENSMFQIGKILIQGVVASFGTVALAANAVANSIGAFPNIAGGAVGLALITVVGQCCGAGKYDEAKKYIFRLGIATYVMMGVVNMGMLLAVKPIVGIFGLAPETTALTIEILVWFFIANMVIWPMSFMLPNGLRAAGDAKFSLVVSTISMWTFRIGFSYLLGIGLGMGVNGTWFAMYADWICRAICFAIRFASGKWQNKRVV
ncbi:MAG: MATE family efflux transporter [Angelakisella sp.]